MVALAIAIAAVAAFIISSVYYSVAPARTVAGEPAPRRPRPWQIALELVRSALVAGLIAGLMSAGDWSGPLQGLLLALALWTVPVVLLAGSVQWEKFPVRTAILHAGDWLVKLLAIGAIAGAFV